ncbi:MAG: hypothetical protein D5R98_03565 [Desulfonatronovibrio sp. MSAO_Bac4]|nr:MAG: hypothetical protein D5R98_03565 [Desulfonatronovibrio sp. MSAO_Bac4]
MKINKIILQAYGHFTDKVLDFSSQDNGLHIIFGPNEAGKSTTMRAIDSFFYGFGHSSPDAYIHTYKDLAVRMILEPEPGQSMDLTRFKRNKNDLVDHQGQAVDSQVMTRIMSGLTREMYSNMFGLDHQNLRLGAQKILEGGGHLGETLFAAASGITNLRLVLESLTRKADDLFRPRAFSRPIWQNIQTISDLNKTLKDLSTRPEQWKDIKDSLGFLQKEKSDLEKELKDLKTSLNWHDRLYKALPLISNHNDVNTRLEELKTIPELGPDFSSRRVSVLTGLNRVRRDIQEQKDNRQKYLDEIQKLTVNEQVLNLSLDIESLFQKASVIAEARENISDLKLEILSRQSIIKEKSALISKQNTLTESDQFELNPRQVRLIENLTREMDLLKSQIEQIYDDKRDVLQEKENIETELNSIPPVRDIKKIDTISKNLSRALEILDQQKQLQAETEKIQIKINRLLNSLSLWKGDFKELAELTLPLTETIDDFDQKLSLSRQNIQIAESELDQIQDQLNKKKQQLKTLDPHQSLPSPKDLPHARKLRDKGWEIIKSFYIENNQQQSDLSDFLNASGATDLTQGFEHFMLKADEIADISLKNASDIASRAALLLEIQDLEKKTSQLDQNLKNKLGEQKELINNWQKIWTPINITPLSPREMAAWISRVKEITSLGEQLEGLLLDKEKTDKMIHSITESSKEVLSMEGVEIPEQIDFITLTALVEEHRERASQQISTRKNLEHDLKKTSNRLKNLELKHNELTNQATEKKNLWKQAVQELNIDPLQNPQEISQEIKICSEISDSLKYLKRLETSKNGLEKKCREFSSQVIKLINKIGDEEKSDSRPEEVVNNVYKKLQKEQEKHARKKDLLDRLDNTGHKLSELNKEFKILEDNLELLCQEAGTESSENLVEVEKKASLAAELRSRLDHINSRLMELAAGEDLNTFMSRARNLGPDELQTTIHELEKEQEEKEPDLEKLIRKITEKELQLKQMDGTSQVPDFEQKIQEQRAVLETNVEQYISLRLAAHILSAEIERYRAANQGPVLQSASEIFRKITLDSFSRIMADYDEKGDPVIKAVRQNDAALQVQDLSDGSRDQLFLALRLGGIHRYLQENPPFPFMADDILVHFDDERSIKTLSVLTELSRKTQVLFFTHHRHLIDLASNIPENNMVKVYELKQD